ncbi:MAG: hypothetical protein IJ935_07350 [Afipia sp.]|nr:hypothetical protein [Afipia sp.]
MTPALRKSLLKLRSHPKHFGTANTMIAQCDSKEKDAEQHAQFAKNARRLQIAQAGQPVTIKSPAEIAATFALGQVLDLQ